MPARDTASLRALHTSPGAPPIDIYVDGTLLITSLAYGQLSGYVEVPTGRHRVQAFPAAAHDQVSPLIDQRLEELEPGEENTLVAVGEPQDVRFLPLHDNTPVPERTQAKVRFVHASPDAPAVDVSLTGNPLLFRQVGFERATPFVVVDSGTVTLELRSVNTGETILTFPDYPLVGGRIYTFVALGLGRDVPPLTILPMVAAIKRCVPA